MNNIILTGFMGSGKTTVGIKLSYLLKTPMIDTDRQIEREQGRSIAEIFEAEGEEYFRRLEHLCLKGMLGAVQGKIISVGGGLPVREDNRELMKELGTVVYLRARPETICQRLKDDEDRPLLKGEDPEKKIAELMEKRAPAYESGADVVIDVDGKSFDEILEEIREAVQNADIGD